MKRDTPWEIRGPYEDGKFALIERVGGEQYGRGLVGSRAEARARHREILAGRRGLERVK